MRALRRRLGDDVGRVLSPGHARFVAILAVLLDTRARTGELVTRRTGHLTDDYSAIEVVRCPQHGTCNGPESYVVPLSPLSRAALSQWLPIRARLTEPLQGSSTALWVSLSHNHAGFANQKGQPISRAPGMPLQQRGLIRSYHTGRHRYELVHLLPPKLEQLRRALEEESSV